MNGTASAIAAGSARAWVLAMRPKTLSVAVAPVVVGTAVAASVGGARFVPAFMALFGAIFIQIGANFANDLFDFQKGADTSARLGPTRATQMGLLTVGEIRAGMIVAFALATMCGAYLVVAGGGWPIAIIGVASIVSGIAYTGGPFPLGYHGLGDVFVFIFFGFVAVCGTAWVQLHSVPTLAFMAAIPVGAISTAVLVVNNVRDESTDRIAGKRTLAVRFGRRAGIAEYLGLVLLAYGAAIAVAAFRASPWPLLAILTAPEAFRLSRFVARERGAALNAALGGTTRLLAIFSLLFAGGIVVRWP